MVPVRPPSVSRYRMSELWVRIGLVAAALAMAAAIALIQRRRAVAPVRAVETGGLATGVYFFSSASCPSCRRAREKLDASIGASRYEELVWEEQPVAFADFGVDAVPAVLIVGEGGRGRLYPGQPERALADL